MFRCLSGSEEVICFLLPVFTPKCHATTQQPHAPHAVAAQPPYLNELNSGGAIPATAPTLHKHQQVGNLLISHNTYASFKVPTSSLCTRLGMEMRLNQSPQKKTLRNVLGMEVY